MNDLGNILLAQSLPAPDSYAAIGWLFVVLGCAALSLNQMHEFWQRLKDKPTAGEVQQQSHAAFATKAELDRHAAEDEQEMKRIEDKVDVQGAKLDTFREEVRKNGDTRRQSIEGKVAEARTEASANFGTLNREMGGMKVAVELLAKQLEKLADQQAR